MNTHIKLYHYRRQAEEQSMIDQLTGIANRRGYERYSTAKWNEARHLRVPFTICIFDIDRFKNYNDTYGHPAGDRVIAAVAKTAACFLRRSTDFLARYGGEEFVAILLGDSSAKAFRHMQKISQAVEDLHIPHGGVGDHQHGWRHGGAGAGKRLQRLPKNSGHHALRRQEQRPQPRHLDGRTHDPTPRTAARWPAA